MDNILRLEAAGKFVVAYLFTLYMGYSWWLFLALLLLPDVSIAAYAMGSKAGAFVYNLFHHQGLAILILALGVYISNRELILAGAVLFGHSNMDRIFGYGLKYNDNFKHTHLGWIGKPK